MGWVTPDFPNNIWDGLSPNTTRTSRSDNIDPNQQDWDQIVAELIATQQAIVDLGGGTSSDNIWTISAGEDLIFGTFVAIQPNGTLTKADSSVDPAVAGVALENKITGQLTDFLTQGKFINMSWNLIPGATYFLSTNGSMSITPPNTGWVIKLGKAMTPTGLDLNIQPPIKL